MLKIYDEYKKHGVDGYYRVHNMVYSNPHHQKIEDLYINYLKELINSNTNIIDIACGDGLIARLVEKHNHNNITDGTDPYFHNKYATYNYSFEDLAMGKLQKIYDMAICCYAFHLINPKWTFNFLNELANITNTFIIITPSKKIAINHPAWYTSKELRDDKITLIILKTNHQNYIE